LAFLAGSFVARLESQKASTGALEEDVGKRDHGLVLFARVTALITFMHFDSP
jgi:hypothetical protein